MNDNATPYPKRPSYFANRVARLLSKSAAAQEIGADGCWLVTVIAMTEDAKRYTGPVTFYNSQLMPIAGFTREHTFIAARDRCAAHGWLHYEKGGNRRPGKYWAEIPRELDGMADSSTDENVSDSVGSADENVSSPKVQLTESSVNASVIPSDLLPIPIPKKERARPRCGDGTHCGAGESGKAAAPSKLMELIDGWNQLGPTIVRPGNGCRREPIAKSVLKGWKRVQDDSEVRGAFDDIPAIIAACRKAGFCHRQGWFDLEWLFSKNKRYKWNVINLLNNQHDGDEPAGAAVHQDTAPPKMSQRTLDAQAKAKAKLEGTKR